VDREPGGQTAGTNESPSDDDSDKIRYLKPFRLPRLDEVLSCCEILLALFIFVVEGTGKSGRDEKVRSPKLLARKPSKAQLSNDGRRLGRRGNAIRAGRIFVFPFEFTMLVQNDDAFGTRLKNLLYCRAGRRDCAGLVA
jgi:hypothetical protein